MNRQTRSNWQAVVFAAVGTVVFLIAASSLAVAQSQSYKVGDRIEAQWKSGAWYTAKILEVKNSQYKISYELDGVIDYVTTDKMRAVGGTKPTQTNSQNSQNNVNNTDNLTAKMAGGFPLIPGTAWKIHWEKRGASGQVFLFCKGGRWEVVSPMLLSGSATLMGTYKVQGSNIISKDADGTITTFKMVWKSGVLELNDGKVTMLLHYNGETQCK